MITQVDNSGQLLRDRGRHLEDVIIPMTFGVGGKSLLLPIILMHSTRT